ncbi:Isochorismatase family protein yecD [Kingella potus]|uniref:Isochorismatase family protein yecD n=1 Tax=Kingella potus TaxID=265175 RepID=A0A377R4C7_9NEIS|nr:cysteine hydrolase family protein [Kingella potus]STR02832.1 Isochorismatase family protein yecD [Kingella potus]
MQKTALLIIDVQQSLLDMRPYRAQEMMDAISLLLHTARTHGREVVYVRHNDAADPMFAPHSPGWQIAGRIAPQPGERVVDKQFNSAFRGTDLRDYLRQQGITRLMVVGMMTEYCIESTVRVAGDLGFDVVLPEGANSTLDNGRWSAREIYEHHNFDIMRGRFAAMPGVEEAAALLAGE